MFRRLGEWIKDWWWEIKFWWTGRNSSVVGGTMERIVGVSAMSLFIVLAIVAGIALLPFFLVFGVVWLGYYLATNAKAVLLSIFDWTRDKIAITLVCTLAGLLLGVCGGATGAAGGAALGFFAGVIFELIRCTPDNGGSWFGLPDDGAYATNNQVSTWNGTTDSGKVYEKPWSWRGFEVNRGPKEDTLRRDV